MSSTKPKLPTIPKEERTPFTDVLLEFIQWQTQRINELEDEIQILKKETRKPHLKPSNMDKETKSSNDDKKQKKPRRKKKCGLKIDEKRVIQPEVIPEGARFKGYRDIIVQDIVLRPHNICYRLAEYKTKEGEYLVGKLPRGIYHGHWGTTLHSFILYQYHHQHVTQPLLLEQLRDIGVDLSSGQLNQLINNDLEDFHAEKDSLLKAGLQYAQYIHADDTKARHAGTNGYCTHIGNELFAWFESTASKSRINFLELLSQGKQKHYFLNAGALEYMGKHKLPQFILDRLEGQSLDTQNEETLKQWLLEQKIQGKQHIRIITEGVLMGGLLKHGIPSNLAIITDDAGQFNVFDHALCWVHAERLVHRLIPLNEIQKEAVKEVRHKIWTLYAQLKAYKQVPDKAQASKLRADFIMLCQTKTDYETLNQVLKRIGKNQHELLRVLDRPEIPLHNNLSERDIRDYVKKRKISGSTRSEQGRRCRDTFASLKKTCRKQGVSFWKYLLDRISGEKQIPPMAELIQKAACGL